MTAKYKKFLLAAALLAAAAPARAIFSGALPAHDHSSTNKGGNLGNVTAASFKSTGKVELSSGSVGVILSSNTVYKAGSSTVTTPNSGLKVYGSIAIYGALASTYTVTVGTRIYGGGRFELQPGATMQLDGVVRFGSGASLTHPMTGGSVRGAPHVISSGSLSAVANAMIAYGLSNAANYHLTVTGKVVNAGNTDVLTMRVNGDSTANQHNYSFISNCGNAGYSDNSDASNVIYFFKDNFIYAGDTLTCDIDIRNNAALGANNQEITWRCGGGRCANTQRAWVSVGGGGYIGGALASLQLLAWNGTMTVSYILTEEIP